MSETGKPGRQYNTKMVKELMQEEKKLERTPHKSAKERGLERKISRLTHHKYVGAR